MATCAILGINEIYAMGGAQAIAAFAYGVSSVVDGVTQEILEPVDLVTGPGNVYVAAAKSASRKNWY